MRLLDVNVLLHAVNPSVAAHKSAKAAVEQAFGDIAGVGLAWTAILGFLRLSTRPGIFARPLTVEQALSVTRAWLSQPRAHVLHPEEQHHDILARLLIGAGAAGNLTTDAHLAALAIEHGATLVTFDRDFERFSGLKLKLLK